MNVNIRLNKNFTTQYNKLQDEFGTEIAKINGFSDEQLSYTDFIENFIDKQVVADSSIDGNSNVSHKDIVTLLSEMPKPHRKLLAFNKIYYEYQKEFGFQAANEWLEMEWTGKLYMHDGDTSTFKHYCFSGDTKFLTDMGVKRLDECEGLSIKVLNKNHVWENATVKCFGEQPLKELVLERYGVEKVIYVTGNHKWFVRMGKTRKLSLVETDDLIEGMKIPFNTVHRWSQSISSPWIVKSIKNTNRVEKVYCAVTESTGSFTLDNNVLTHNCFAYDLKELAERGLYFIGDGFNALPPKHLITFVDFVKEFIGYASNRSSGAVGLPNLIPYMFYFWKKDCDEGYMGIITDEQKKKYAESNFQRFLYSVNQPYVRDGQQSAFTNTSVFDHPYFEALFGGSEFPDGTFMIDYEEEIIEFQKWYMETMSQVRSENMFTFPVSTISLLRKEGEYDLNSLDAFVDEEFAEWAIKHNMKWSDSNIFQDTSVNSLSNCCRLKSDIREMGYFNSVGGTALKVGSVKVSTINLARIALDTKNEEEYLKELAHRTLVDVRVLHVIRKIIERNVDKGLLPNFTYGLVDFKHLYNTIGFIGIYESMKKFGYTTTDEFGNVYYTDKAADFGKKIFDTMRKVADDFITEVGADYMINTEQIPGESAAAKLMKKDKFFYPKARIYDLPLYGNQFIPLGIKTTLQERVRIQAMFDGFCNGGSILHANIDTPFDSYEKALRMTNYIAQQGVTYFAFNTRIQVCEDNHAFYGTVCPVCGKPVDAEFTRVVGFYTKINTWTKERRSEYKLRRWESVNSDTE